MKIDHINIFQYSLPFVKPFEISQKAINERRGLIIQGVAEKSLVGYGEIAPLAGFSRESLADCLDPAKAVAQEITKSTVPRSPHEIAQLMETLGEIPPTVAFGFELMLLDLAAKFSGRQLARWLRSDASNSIAINAVLAGGDVESQVRIKLANDFGTFKLKIGAGPLEDDIARVRKARALIGANSKLRLDANRAFDFQSASRVLAELSNIDIEYIEEPLREPSTDDLRKLRSNTNVPIAIDETLIEWRAGTVRGEVFLSNDQLTAFEVAVCKPALMGGVSQTLKIAEQLRSHGKQVVVTSSLDTGIGVTAALQIACALRIEAACGLDTVGIFQKQLVSFGPPIENGRLSLPGDSGLGVSLDLVDVGTDFIRKFKDD